jgi:hypothetical protein
VLFCSLCLPKTKPLLITTKSSVAGVRFPSQRDSVPSSNQSTAFPEVPSKKAITEHISKLKRDTAGSGSTVPATNTPRSANITPRKRASVAASKGGSSNKKSKKAAEDSDDDEEVRIHSNELKDITNSATRFTAGGKPVKPLNLSVNTAFANAQAAAAKSAGPVTPRSARKASHAANAAIKTHAASDESKDSDLENAVVEVETKLVDGNLNKEQRRRLDALRRDVDGGDDAASIYESANEDVNEDDPMEV